MTSYDGLGRLVEERHLMTAAAEKRPIYLDCDTGIDDSLALAYLLASPDVELVGVGTVSGNTSAAQAARNSLALLELAGRSDVPVAVGAHDPLRGRFDGGVPHIHGHNGIGGVEVPEASRRPEEGTAAELLLRLSREYEGALEVVAVGPQTNLARALALDPALAGRVAAVTAMGGAALAPGNVTAVAEANIWNDPEAAQIVIEAGWKVTLVPLDITLENTLDEGDRARLLASPVPLARALGQMLDHYFEFYLPLYGVRSCPLHDPMAAAVAARGVVPTRAPAVAVEVDTTDGPGRGQTIADLRGQRRGALDQEGATVRVVLEIDRPLGPHLVDLLV
ncbi:nucleoside hydrolase [Naasia sp. SYSU D00057]|uniref:nucleoside hydrolase n=1 Tax=Naasia sp. SYSU D00057 TaxID=2817380 RepID=UPI0027DCBF9A|nr:nucleoside hydrolase [Naasia sp. SYSU D00057]